MKNIVLNNVPVQDYASIESFNTLATNVTFSGSQFKIVMVTSCISNEGKSFVAFNLVRTLGSMGYRAVLVDADLRKSVLVSHFQARSDGPILGLTHFLAGKAQMEDVVYQTNLRNVYLAPNSKDVLNSLPLLTSSAFSDLLQTLKSSFDFVIVDSPPVGLVIDAAMIASACDATILVVANEKVSKRELIEAKQQIDKSGCMVLGTVLNKVTLNTHKSRRYYYKSYYSHYGADNKYGEYGSNGVKPPKKQESAATASASKREAKPQAGAPGAR